MTEYVINCLLGSAIIVLSTNLFYLTHSHALNLADLFYTLTVLRPSTYIYIKNIFFIICLSFQVSFSPLVFSLMQ